MKHGTRNGPYSLLPDVASALPSYGYDKLSTASLLRTNTPRHQHHFSSATEIGL